MRVSPCGFAARSLKEAEALAGASALPTHNHPEGIKGAKAVAGAVHLARTGHTRSEIGAYIRENYYPLDKSLAQIRPEYRFDVTCQGTVPPAIQAFLESTSFEDAIRNAISIGGDSDTVAAVTGGIAEAYYGIPYALRQRIEYAIDKECLYQEQEIIRRFRNKYYSAFYYKTTIRGPRELQPGDVCDTNGCEPTGKHLRRRNKYKSSSEQGGHEV